MSLTARGQIMQKSIVLSLSFFLFGAVASAQTGTEVASNATRPPELNTTIGDARLSNSRDIDAGSLASGAGWQDR